MMSWESWSRVVAGVVILVIAFGIGTTYERYRGTDHSRVPRVGRATAFTGLRGDEAAPTGDSRLATVSTHTVPVAVPAYRSTAPLESSGGNTDELQIYPTITKGMRTPFDLHRYYGRGTFLLWFTDVAHAV